VKRDEEEEEKEEETCDLYSCYYHYDLYPYCIYYY
jgi:hypothetical protein